MGEHVALARVPSCCCSAGAAGWGSHSAVLSPPGIKGTWPLIHWPGPGLLARGCLSQMGMAKEPLWCLAPLLSPRLPSPLSKGSQLHPLEKPRSPHALPRQRPPVAGAALACAAACAAVLAPAVLGWRMLPSPWAVLFPSSQKAHCVAFWAGFLHCLTQIGPSATSDLSSSFLNPGLSSL